MAAACALCFCMFAACGRTVSHLFQRVFKYWSRCPWLGYGQHFGSHRFRCQCGILEPGRAYKCYFHPSLSAMHAEYFSGIGKYDFISAAFPISGEKPRTIGVSMLRFGVDDIPNTLLPCAARWQPQLQQHHHVFFSRLCFLIIVCCLGNR